MEMCALVCSSYRRKLYFVPLPRVSYRRTLISKNKLFAIFLGDIMSKEKATIRNQASTGKFSSQS